MDIPLLVLQVYLNILLYFLYKSYPFWHLLSPVSLVSLIPNTGINIFNILKNLLTPCSPGVQQVFSLPAPGRTRTGDLLITNQLLYQLSHGSAFLILLDFQRYNYTIGFPRCQPRFRGSFSLWARQAPRMFCAELPPCGRGGRRGCSAWGFRPAGAAGAADVLRGASARRHVGRGGHLLPRRPI